MRKPEQRVWDSFKRQAAKYPLELERVENVVGDGTPDVHVTSRAGFKWIELKAAKLPKRETTRVLGDDGLRQSQKNWHKVAAYYGAPAYTLIRDDKGNLYLLHCAHSETINDMTQSDLRFNSCAHTWEDIFKELLK